MAHRRAGRGSNQTLRRRYCMSTSVKRLCTWQACLW